MPDDSESPQPETPQPQPPRRTGAAFSGQTTRSFSEQPVAEDDTVRAPRETIGDFEVIGKLGQGGMGAVYRARQISLDRQVALKILPANMAADADFVTRFQREGRMAASLSHENLVKVYSSGKADGCHFIAMELVEGETLGQFLKRGPLPIPDALRICLDVARALQCGWNRAQLIHRDIKPGNIFLSERGEVKVGDLGLAKSMAETTTGMTRTGTAMGTPNYISPEQTRGDKDLDFRADIYSLGCTLYHMLTGRTPYGGSDPMAVMSMHRDAPPPAILKVMPQCPIPLARLVAKMLKKAKRERHASYEELIAEIERVQAIFAPAESELETVPRQTPSGTPSAPEQEFPPGSKSKLLLYCSIAVGLVVMAIVGFLIWPKEEKLTQAQLAMKRKAEGQSSAPAPSPAPPILASAPAQSVTALTTTKERWQNALRDPALAAGRYGVGAAPEGFILNQQCFISLEKGPKGNGGLRLRATMTEKHSGFGMVARERLIDKRRWSYLLQFTGASVLLSRLDDSGIHGLTEAAIEPPPTVGEDFEMELRAVGSRLVARFNGHDIIEWEGADPTPGDFGLFGSSSDPQPIKRVEYFDLSPEAVTDEAWQDMLATPENLQLREGASIVGLELTLRHYGSAAPKGSQQFRDGAMRIKFRYNGIASPKLCVRDSPGPSRYSGGLAPGGASIFLTTKDQNYIPLRETPLPQPLSKGQECVLEFRIVGRKMSLFLNGAILCEAEDSRLTSGEFVIWNFSPEPFVVESLEFLPIAS